MIAAMFAAILILHMPVRRVSPQGCSAGCESFGVRDDIFPDPHFVPSTKPPPKSPDAGLRNFHIHTPTPPPFDTSSTNQQLHILAAGQHMELESRCANSLQSGDTICVTNGQVHSPKKFAEPESSGWLM
jgi:hypothetical protein